MKIGELVEKIEVFKEEANVLVQVTLPGPKAGVYTFPIKEVRNKDHYVVLIAKEQGGT